MKRMYAATIGFFDGVHKGHQCLINQLLHESEQLRLGSMVVTFDKHPRQVLHADYVPELLSSLQEKVKLLEQTGVDKVTVLHFTPQMASMNALQFMRDVLAAQLGVSVLLMGYDHQFGHGGGTFAQYVEWGRQCGIQVLLAKELDEGNVSSSMVRRLLLAGDVSSAGRLLGRPYPLTGTVEGGHRIGHQLGYPTANLVMPADKLVPACGVYAVNVLLPDGTRHGGMLCIGHRPTLHNGDNLSVEVHVLDFNGDLYNKVLTLEMVERVRPEQAFPSVDELRRQLTEDEKVIRGILERG